ncbi:MAG TPA: ATP-binding cassette domain-containing protein [Gammaproteobacteria bacterium]|nr:ATP-binding cassette domain-containing protein [Gammaproteobacteria bacterium]
MTIKHKKEEDIILSVKNIVNHFGKQTVHKGVNFDVVRGEILGIVGGSGSGKSVLLKTMTGLHNPNKGKVLIDGKSIQDIASFESASLLGVLFQEGALFSSLNVEQNIMLPLREYTSLKEAEQRKLAELKLAMVGMELNTATKYPAELSGGMAKRVALARALAMDPLILFLDEPTAGLDPINATGFDELIRNLNESLGVTIVMVTHDLNTLFTICDRVAVLVDKTIIINTIPNLLEQDHPWIQEFFHGPRGQGALVAAKHYARSANGNR